MAANSILAKMLVEISANTSRFGPALTKSQRDISSFTNGITKLAKTLGVAFGVQQVASFALEISRLAGEAEAVSAAFERLPQSTKLMRELKDATGGTVSELALMKRAVQASNFDISLQALPKLLEFATLRAQQTGQSVDYLVDSIVTGIGRKSKLILDNLGISAVQLNEALGDTAIGAASIGQVADAVGRIIDKNLDNMNSFMDTNATKLQRLGASWENYKIAVGEAANETGLLGDTIDGITGTLDALSTKDLTFFEKLRLFLSGPGAAGASIGEAVRREAERIEREQRSAAHVIEQVDKAFVKFKGNVDEFAKAISPDHPLRGKFLEEFKRRVIEANKVQITNLESLKDKEKELVAQFNETDITDKAKLNNIAGLVTATREQIKAIEDLLKAQENLNLSRAGKGALAGDAVTKVNPFGELITKTTPFGGVLQQFKGIAGEETPLADALPVDLDKMAAMAQQMVDLRNASLNATTEMTQHWIDLSGVVGGAVTSLAEGLGGAIVGVEDFGETVINAFAGFAKEFGSMLIASGIAALALEKLIKNPVAAIAAGVALVAVAGAASASLQKSHAGLTGGGGSSAPGRLPSERVEVGGRIRGYDLALVSEKESYRRGRLG